MYAVYIAQEALEKAERHFKQQARLRLEAMGLLTGNAYTHAGGKFVFVKEYLTANNDSSAISVRFSRNAFSDIASQIHGASKDALVVGWMHSHPGYGCFMSSTDIATQRNYFSEEFNVALVADPLKSEDGRMVLRAYRLAGSGYEEVSYAVVTRK